VLFSLRNLIHNAFNLWVKLISDISKRHVGKTL